MSDVTRLLNAIECGDPQAAEELLPLVYEELRRLATQRMAREAAGHTLQPTALVHEAWLRLAGDWRSSVAVELHHSIWTKLTSLPPLLTTNNCSL